MSDVSMFLTVLLSQFVMSEKVGYSIAYVSVEANQYYEIIARDLESGNVQVASSMNAPPRNLYFNEGKNYSLIFNSIGGQHVDDLPYRVSMCACVCVGGISYLWKLFSP